MVTTTTAEPTGRRTDPETGERTYEYPPTGELLDSVTSVINGTEFKPWIPKWYATSALGWAADNIGAFVQTLVTSGRGAAVDLGKGAAEQIRDVKRDAGSHVHNILKRLILWAASPEGHGGDIALPDLPEHLVGVLYDGEPIEDVVDHMITGFTNWVSHFNPRFIASEMTVYNEVAGVAGTLDAIVELDGYWLNAKGDLVVGMPGKTLVPCIDAKSGRDLSGVREQLAAYRRMTECLLPLGQLHPMPRTNCGMVLHLRPEYPHGYLFMIVAGSADEEAWERFQAAAKVYRGRQKVKGKPGQSVRALRPDGTMPGPRICDLAGEGYGRALAPLARALGADAELEDVARFSQEELLAVKGIGPKLAADIRDLLAERGLAQQRTGLETVLDVLRATSGPEVSDHASA